MSQREMSVLLKVLDVLSVAGCLVVGFVMVSRMCQVGMLVQGVFFGIGIVPMLAAAVFSWAIFSDIAKGQSFTEKNAGRLRVMAYLAAASTAVWLVEIIMLATMPSPHDVIRISSLPIFYLLIAVILAVFCAALAAVCVALSHLTASAADIKSENDLMV